MKLETIIKKYKDKFGKNQVLILKDPVEGGNGLDVNYSFLYKTPTGKIAHSYEPDYCPIVYPKPSNYKVVGIFWATKEELKPYRLEERV
jgi:hypothetical protein